MYEVVEEHLPVGEKALPIKQDLVAPENQFPVLFPSFVWRGRECFTDLGCAFIEGTDELRGRLKRQWFVAAGGKIHLRRSQNTETETGKLSNMRR